MIDLILKLIDQCKELVKRREEVNKNFYTSFVAPAFADFEAVHKNYLDSFKGYQLLLEDTSVFLNADHPIFAAVENDNLFSEDIRFKVRALFRVAYDAEEFGAFIIAIKDYLECALPAQKDLISGFKVLQSGERDFNQRGQMIRTGFLRGLKEIIEKNSSETKKRELALNNLRIIVAQVQSLYSIVIETHSELKQTLLIPK